MEENTRKIMKQHKTYKLLLLLKMFIYINVLILIFNANKINNSNRLIKMVSCMVDVMNGSSVNYHREKILDKHNYLRSIEAGAGWELGAVFMLRLSYDIQLEKYASNYAKQLCYSNQFIHSERKAPLRVARGENLYVNSVDYSDDPKKFDSGEVVQKWWNERTYFNWNSEDPERLAISQNKMIGHWTQVVRADASQVGCAIVTGCQCTGCFNSGNKIWSTYMVCHYDAGNLGWFPYWPIKFPEHIPKNIPSNRRQRCGNCPKGYRRCGTTAGQQKRDAHLCVGFAQPYSPSPPENLLQISLDEKTKYSIPTWLYMIRECSVMNGGCPTNDEAGGSSCWSYKNGSQLTTEPSIIINQCLCNNFSSDKGVWFEKDSCKIYRASSYNFIENKLSNRESFLLDQTGVRHKIKPHRESFVEYHEQTKKDFGKLLYEKPYYDYNAKSLSAVETISPINAVEKNYRNDEEIVASNYEYDEHQKKHLVELHDKNEDWHKNNESNTEIMSNEKNKNNNMGIEKIAEISAIERELNVEKRSNVIRGTRLHRKDEYELAPGINRMQDNNYNTVNVGNTAEKLDYSNNMIPSKSVSISTAKRDFTVNPFSGKINKQLDISLLQRIISQKIPVELIPKIQSISEEDNDKNPEKDEEESFSKLSDENSKKIEKPKVYKENINATNTLHE